MFVHKIIPAITVIHKEVKISAEQCTDDSSI